MLAAYGRRIGIRATRAEVLARIASAFPVEWQSSIDRAVEHLYSVIAAGPHASGVVRRSTIVYAGAFRIARTIDADEAMHALESDLHRYLAETSRTRVFVHAGVVGWRGRAIVIPGRSLSGKSTLVAAFIRAGATYGSDEYAVLDPGGRVHPYPKRISLRETSTARPVPRDVAALGGVAATTALPVGLVLHTGYRLNARWRPRLLSPAQAALCLLANTVPARARPRAVMSTLRKVASRAVTLSGIRGEADALVQRALGLVGEGDGRLESSALRAIPLRRSRAHVTSFPQ